MNKKLTIAGLQSELVWEKPSLNRNNFSEKIKNINFPVDIVLLPEMFTSGFTMNPEVVAETMNGTTVQWMKTLAMDYNTAIAGSIVIYEDGLYFNRFLFVQPSGELNYYDKKHLFTLAGEDKKYTAGNEKVIINYKDWKISLLVCYDLRFPVWARNVENYDVLIYIANWPKTRINAWDTLLKARSIENMSYTIGVNRVGVDDAKLEYCGHSAAYDCLGEPIANTSPYKEETLLVTLEKNHISEVRNKLNFLNDKDNFKLD